MIIPKRFIRTLLATAFLISVFGTACAIEDEYGMSVDLVEQSLDHAPIPPDVMEKLDCNDDCTCPPPRAGCTPRHISCGKDSDTNTCDKAKACEYRCVAAGEPLLVDNSAP